MKKTLLTLTTALLLINAKAQIIRDGGFENWTMSQYEEPATYGTSNDEALKNNIGLVVTKAPGLTGQHAVKLETKTGQNKPQFGFISNGQDDPMQGKGGVPYSQKPIMIYGNYQSNILPNDKALLIVNFKKNGTVISTNMYEFTSTQTVVSTFSLSIQPYANENTPDSVIIAAVSSDAFGQFQAPGNFIILDNIHFTGQGITQDFPNGDFEMWNNKQSFTSNDWKTNG